MFFFLGGREPLKALGQEQASALCSAVGTEVFTSVLLFARELFALREDKVELRGILFGSCVFSRRVLSVVLLCPGLVGAIGPFPET